MKEKKHWWTTQINPYPISTILAGGIWENEITTIYSVNEQAVAKRLSE